MTKKKNTLLFTGGLMAAALTLPLRGDVQADKTKGYPNFPRTTEIVQLYCGIDPEIHQHVVLAATSACEGDSVLCDYSYEVPKGGSCAQALARLRHVGFDMVLAQSDEFAFDVHYTLERIKEIEKKKGPFGK